MVHFIRRHMHVVFLEGKLVRRMLDIAYSSNWPRDEQPWHLSDLMVTYALDDNHVRPEKKNEVARGVLKTLDGLGKR
jgi:hypothetical protein